MPSPSEYWLTRNQSTAKAPSFICFLGQLHTILLYWQGRILQAGLYKLSVNLALNIGGKLSLEASKCADMIKVGVRYKYAADTVQFVH